MIDRATANASAIQDLERQHGAIWTERPYLDTLCHRVTVAQAAACRARTRALQLFRVGRVIEAEYRDSQGDRWNVIANRCDCKISQLRSGSQPDPSNIIARRASGTFIDTFRSLERQVEAVTDALGLANLAALAYLTDPDCYVSTEETKTARASAQAIADLLYHQIRIMAASDLDTTILW